MGNEVVSPAAIVSEIMKNGDGRKSFRNQKLAGAVFDGLDLRGADFRMASVPFCSFRGTNLKYANFEGANCCKADFTNADLHRANFKDANLSNAKWYAKDLFGVTLTMDCSSFTGLELDDGWWWGFVMYALLMKPPSEEARDRLIAAMGPERYRVLRAQYMREI